ncbi:Mu transposase domain-containing protein [Streptomyces sp. NPDC005141]
MDRYSQITVRTNRYSVPVRLIGKKVRSCCTPLTWWFTTRTWKWPGMSV